MVDAERLEALRVLTSLYRPGDYQAATMAMPKFTEDESGEDFEEFFDFLQSIYVFQSEYLDMTEEEISSVAQSLLRQAKEYGYPVNQVEAFLNVTFKNS